MRGCLRFGLDSIYDNFAVRKHQECCLKIFHFVNQAWKYLGHVGRLPGVFALHLIQVDAEFRVDCGDDVSNLQCRFGLEALKEAYFTHFLNQLGAGQFALIFGSGASDYNFAVGENHEGGLGIFVPGDEATEPSLVIPGMTPSGCNIAQPEGLLGVEGEGADNVFDFGHMKIDFDGLIDGELHVLLNLSLILVGVIIK